MTGGHVTDDTARYDPAAATIYAEFRSMPVIDAHPGMDIAPFPRWADRGGARPHADPHDVHHAAWRTDSAIEDFVAPPGPRHDFWNDYITPEHPSGCSHAAVITAVKPVRAATEGGRR